MPRVEDYVLVPRRIPALQLRDGDILEVGRNAVSGVRHTAGGVQYRVRHRMVRAQPADPVRILVPEIR